MLKLKYKDERKPSIWLVSPVLKIGHDKNCDIVIDDEGVADIQAELYTQDEAISIKPLGSGPSTLVNENIITQFTGLNISDIIRIGETELEVIDPLQEHQPLPSIDEEIKTGARTKIDNKWMLKSTSSPFQGRTFTVQDRMTIGRDKSSDITIPLNHVSRKHAELLFNANQLLIKDLGSRNGTFVNGKKISKQLLKHKDEIRIDMISFMVVAPNAESNDTEIDPTATIVRSNANFDPLSHESPLLRGEPARRNPYLKKTSAPHEEKATHKAFLHGVSGPANGQLYELEKKQNFVGKMLGNFLPLEGDNASARHTQISQEGGGSWRFHSQDTFGVTAVNGRITAEARLIDGDRIQIGENELVFQCVGSQPRPPVNFDNDDFSDADSSTTSSFFKGNWLIPALLTISALLFIAIGLLTH
ncbi:MAG: FHA domain-containing protein [Pseudomonadota bacterium]